MNEIIESKTPFPKAKRDSQEEFEISWNIRSFHR